MICKNCSQHFNIYHENISITIFDLCLACMNKVLKENYCIICAWARSIYVKEYASYQPSVKEYKEIKKFVFRKLGKQRKWKIS